MSLPRDGKMARVSQAPPTPFSVTGDPDPAVEVVQVDPESSLRAARAAFSAVRRMMTYSRVIDPSREELIAPLRRQEVLLGRLLGSGGFSDVYEIQSIDLIPLNGNGSGGREKAEEEKAIAAKPEVREFLSKHCIRESTGDARYAIKFLRPEVMSDRRKFKTGAADLAIEAKFLSSLEHPNIVKMRGVTACGVRGFASGTEAGYFLVLDRLYDTLDERIHVTWKRDQRKYKGKIRRNILDYDGQKRREMMASRLKVAFDIAGALMYLHERNIIYRDLKPENIGFDCRGDVKVFDFGLAKELFPEQVMENGTYEMSGNTGSLRYMAPEVNKSQPYNLSADVYSFALVLWEMISLEKPYADFTRNMHSQYVVQNGVRPPLDPKWSMPVRSLLKRSWAPDIPSRPSMANIYKILKKQVAVLRKGDETGLEHATRRSTFVLQKNTNLDAVMECVRKKSERAIQTMGSMERLQE